MIRIEEVSPIYSKISDVSAAQNFLCVKREYWKKSFKKNNKGKECKEYIKFLINKEGFFLTGFIDRLNKYLKNDVEIDRIDYDLKFKEPHLPGIVFREDQLNQISTALKKNRGVLLAPTGSGKTVLIAGLISCFPSDSRILFLVHTIDLVNQTINEFKRFGFSSVSKIGDGEKDWSGKIIVSSIQTFAKFNPEDFCDRFDAVFVDEAHHVSGLPDEKKPQGGTYYKVLSNLLTPIRFGITATLSSNNESMMCLEGLIGPVIDELTFEEATDMEILAVPKVQLIKVNHFSSYEVSRYADIYDLAIVNNRARNRQIISAIKKLNAQGLTTVTYVQRKDHIDNLMQMGKQLNVELFEVQGKTKSNERMLLKKLLHEKKIQNVISTVVWREGMNIKSLNAIVIAGGGKDEKDLIQACGRGARKDENKDKFVIVDFVDSAKYLSQHFCERLGVYLSKGWI